MSPIYDSAETADEIYHAANNAEKAAVKLRRIRTTIARGDLVDQSEYEDIANALYQTAERLYAIKARVVEPHNLY